MYTDVEEVWESKPSSSTVYTDRNSAGFAQTTSRHVYLKGYRISTATGKMITLPKWDFGGDKSFTNRVWNGIVENLRALSPDNYPLRISDLDQAERPLFIINTPVEFEAWLIHDFDVKDYLRPKS